MKTGIEATLSKATPIDGHGGTVEVALTMEGRKRLVSEYAAHFHRSEEEARQEVANWNYGDTYMMPRTRFNQLLGDVEDNATFIVTGSVHDVLPSEAYRRYAS